MAMVLNANQSPTYPYLLNLRTSSLYARAEYRFGQKHWLCSL